MDLKPGFLPDQTAERHELYCDEIFQNLDPLATYCRHMLMTLSP